MKVSMRVAFATVCTVAVAMIGWQERSQACGEATSVGGALEVRMDGFIPLDEADAATGLASFRVPAGPAGPSIPPSVVCPVPPCATTTCATANSNTPFVRVPGTESAPIFGTAGCFGIAKKNANFYVQLTMEGPVGGTMHRNYSTDGINWVQGGSVLDPANHWFSGMKCPDPHFIGDQGDMVVYFNATGTSGGITRATSTDDGLTWTVDPSPLITAGVSGYFVDNPSVVQRNPNLWIMAYTYGCSQVSGPFQMAETHLAYSTDGINWTKSPFNPAITVGGCGAWDQGGIANPVILNDPTESNTIHLFYTGANWNGNTTRGCAKFGHAISTNGGRTFCKTGVVLDHPPAASPAWDDRQYMVGSYIVEPNNKIRAYYWAQGTGATFGLGVAEANWPLPGCPSTEGIAQGEIGMADGLEPDVGFESLADGSVLHLRAQPNPTNGHTFIEHNLRRGQFEGAGVLSVFDIQGREVVEVWNGRLEDAPARFEWNGTDRGGSRVAAGRYLIRLNRGGQALATSWVTVMP